MRDIVPYRNGGPLPALPATEPVLPPYPPAEDEFDLRRAVRVLRRRAVLVLTVTALALVVTTWLVVREVPQYRASAAIRLVDQRRAMTGGIEIASQDLLKPADDPVLTQIEVLRTRTVAASVVNRLGLRLRAPSDDGLRLADVSVDGAAPDTLALRFAAAHYTLADRDTAVSAPYGVAAALGGVSMVVAERPAHAETTVVVQPLEEAVDSLLRSLRARARENTDVVDVEFTSPDAALAQLVVNTVVDEFRALNARQAQEQSRRRRAFLAAQLGEMDSLLSAAQLELSEFRRRERVFSSREKFVTEQAGLTGLEVRREELVAERRMFAGLLRDLSESSDADGLLVFASSPGIAQNPVMSRLYTQLLAYEAAFDSLTLGDHARARTDPDVQRLDGLIAATRRKLADALSGHVDALGARIAALDGLRNRSTAEMAQLPDAEAEEVRLVQDVETIRRMADQLRVEYQKARIAEAVEGGQVEVLDYASLPLKPVPARRGFKLALGLLVGLIAASGAAFAVEQLNTSISAPDELEGTLRVPGLAVIPRMMTDTPAPRLRLPGRPHGAHEQHAQLVTANGAQSASAEAYRKLRTNLIFAQTLQHVRRLLVTSASPGEGKTTVAANLGVTFANQGMRVLLVDADLRRPTLHRAFAVPQAPGLTQVVLGQDRLEDIVQQTRVDNLFLLPAGTLPPNPAELLGQEQSRALFTQLTAGFDLIIVDSPPVGSAADSAVLSTMVDGTLLIVRAGETDRAMAQQAIHTIESVGGKVVGAVLNDPDAKLPRYGQQYRQYYGRYPSRRS